jgi:LCP family protein required for cell wall assembly
LKIKNPKTIILIILLAVISITAGAGLRIYIMLHPQGSDIISTIEKNIDSTSKQYAALKEQGRFNILIIGEDDVEGSKRSDTVLFATIDIDDKNMRIISLPRDTRVNIPGHGYQKLNHAFAYGGTDLLKATLEKYLNEPILYYVLLDYDSFPSLVDKMGGVEIDVEKRMRYVDRAGKLDINIKAGRQHMDGKTALHYVRFRKDALGDIGRVQRQQKFIKALIRKAYDPRVLVKLPQITSEMMKVFKTDMTPTLAVQLAGFVQNELGKDRIFFSMLNGRPVTINMLSYWMGDTKAANTFLHAPIEALISRDLPIQDIRYGNITLTYSSAEDASDNEEKEKKNDNDKSADNDNDEKSGKKDGKDNELNDKLSKLANLNAMIKSISEPIAVLNGAGIGGLSSEFATKFQKMGIDVTHTGNAKHFDYKYSNIVYPPGSSKSVIESAKTVGKMLGIPKNLVRANNQAFYASVIIGHDYKSLRKKLEDLTN